MYDVMVHHVLFMSNHIHILLTPRKNNLGQAMSYFLTNVSKCLNQKLNRTNHIFGSRYRPTVIQDPRHCVNVVKYIYQNPVRAKICKQVTDYRYSSLGQYLGLWNDGIQIVPDDSTKDIFDMGLEGRESWMDEMNSLLFEDDVEILRNAFKKRKFKFTKRQLMSLYDRGTKLKI